MAFKAIPAMTGIPDFGLVHIDPLQVANTFQTYIDTGSKLTGVSLDDIELTVTEIPGDLDTVTLVDLLNVGMRLFDAIVWLTAGKPESHALVQDETKTKDKVSSLHEVARSVFYVYFMLLTQARYPVSRNTTEKPKIPNFLKTIMGMDKDQHEYVEQICSFDPQKFDPKWVCHIEFNGMGQEVLSRFGLGVAGYRMFGPFSLYEPKTALPNNLKNACAFAKAVAKSPASWAIHPLTRDPNINTSRGNLNKNLGNLILEAFTEAQIAEMAASKVLFGIPKKEPAHREYLQWEAINDISGVETIFKRPAH